MNIYLNILLVEVAMGKVLLAGVVAVSIREPTRVEALVLAQVLQHLHTLAPRPKWVAMEDSNEYVDMKDWGLY